MGVSRSHCPRRTGFVEQVDHGGRRYSQEETDYVTEF